MLNFIIKINLFITCTKERNSHPIAFRNLPDSRTYKPSIYETR